MKKFTKTKCLGLLLMSLASGCDAMYSSFNPTSMSPAGILGKSNIVNKDKGSDENEKKALELNEEAVSDMNYSHDYLNAISSLKQALSLEFENEELTKTIKRNLANAYIRQGDEYAGENSDYEKSIENYNEAIYLFPENKVFQDRVATIKSCIKNSRPNNCLV